MRTAADPDARHYRACGRAVQQLRFEASLARSPLARPTSSPGPLDTRSLPSVAAFQAAVPDVAGGAHVLPGLVGQAADAIVAELRLGPELG